MATYLLHLTRSGEPVGVFSEDEDYYDPQWEHFRARGLNLVFSKPPTASWEDFTARLAQSHPSPTERWDLYKHSSTNLAEVYRSAVRDVERIGDE